MPKVLRITTVPVSLNILLKGQLKFMVENGFDIIAASASGPEVDELTKRERVSHTTVRLTRRISPFTDLIALFQTVALIRKVKPEIIHSHTPKAGLIGMLAGCLCKVPIRMHTVAGMPLMEARGITKILLNLTEYITYRCATNIYPNSFNLQEWIVKNVNVKKEKVEMLANGSSNGINSTYFTSDRRIRNKAGEIKSRLSISNDSIVFVFVGRLVKDKGMQELVLAFERILENKKAKTDLILVGSYEDDRDPVPKKVKDVIKNTPNIHEVGFQSDVRPYLEVADVFAFPSYREGFPNVIMQAACFNLPVIATDINGCNELVINGRNGLLVKPKDTLGLYNAMVELLENKALRERMAKLAREVVVEKYDQQLVWEAILNEYKRLLILKGVRETDKSYV